MKNQTLKPAIAEVIQVYKEGDHSFKTWPPVASDPIVLGKDGTVISRFGDDCWNISDWYERTPVLNFGGGPQRNNMAVISKENAHLFRILIAWFLFGPRAARKWSTLVVKHKLFRPLFIHCSANNIVATDLYRFPLLIEQLASKFPPSRMHELIAILHIIWEQREELGFYILDPLGLTRFSACADVLIRRKHSYIPPRI